MAEHDGPPDGNRSAVTGGGLDVDGGEHDGDHQEVGSNDFQEEGTSDGDAAVDGIDTDIERGTVVSVGFQRGATDSVVVGIVVAAIGEAGGASPHNERTNHGSRELRYHVQETGDRGLFSKGHEGQGDGWVDVAARDVADAVDQDRDTETEGDGNRDLHRNDTK